MTNASDTRTNHPSSTLHRSGHERIFAGVAGGLGEHLGYNPWWFRLAFVLLALFAGVGVLLYVIAWIVIPGPDEDEPIVSGWVNGVDWSDGGAVFGVVLVGAAGILVATQVVNVSGVLVLSAVLFVFGLLLYRGDLRVPTRQGSTPPPPSGSDTVDVQVSSAVVTDERTPASGSGGGIAGEAATGGSGTVASDGPPPPTRRPPRPPRERSMLGRLTIAVGLIVVASMALVDISDLAVVIEPFHYFAAVVAILATGLLVGAWLGRARWLIIIGILITPLLWVSMLLPTSWNFSVGEFQHSPTTVQDVAGPYEQGIGQMRIDLTGLSPAELAQLGTIEASLGLGEMVVVVPDDVGVVLRARVGAGEVSGPFDTIEGVGVNVRREFGPEPTVLVLDLEVGAGVVTITGPAGIGSGESHNDDIIVIEGSN